MPPVFPSPTLVVGLGRLGLGVLERLGDDWMGLQMSGADASLKNLRLLWLHPGEGSEEAWREGESRPAVVASEMGEGDLPSLALDFVALRSLGLVRYRDGAYQVAVPRDAGALDLDRAAERAAPEGDDGSGAPTGAPADDPRRQLRVVRRRYFEWLSLSPDPVIAVERLHRLLERHHDSDLFVTPILNRVHQGHSPRVLLAVIARCRALAAGRDPAPWKWLRSQFGAALGQAISGLPLDLRLTDSWLGSAGQQEDFEAVAPEPMEGWSDWLRRRTEEPQRPEQAPAEEPSGLLLSMPGPFVPRADDFISPLDPFKFLEVDWETTGWASVTSGHLRITAVKPGHFRLGLFDHAAGDAQASAALLGSRLQVLAKLVYQGLVRLWVDLQRERVDDLDPDPQRWRRQEALDAALRQSLELLGELLVRPLVAEAEPGGLASAAETLADDPAAPAAPPELPASPSAFLQGLVAERRDLLGKTESALTERLAELGCLRQADDGGGQEVQPLFQQVALTLADGRGEDDGAADERSPGLLELRRVLNRVVRQLYSFAFLAEYRHRPTRHPPRLTVYVVGDMGEPFTRTEMRNVLREVHAELLRSFSPIFEFYREGFNHCLAVVPILWMPHPADPFGGASPTASRGEEAAIIDRVHGIRRWVESVLPPSRRRISQIFVNGRVTDSAVLSLHDAVRQTRDFISFQSRNDLGADDWLRRTATGGGGGDYFSSFACYEIDFPTERCREYLANRLARLCLARLRSGRTTALEPLAPPALAPRPAAELMDEGGREIEQSATAAGDEMAGEVRGRIAITRETPLRKLLAAFDQDFEETLRGKIIARWTELIRRRGRVDDLVDDLRRKIAEQLLGTLSEVQRHSDTVIEEQAGQGGLPAALSGFERLRTAASEELQRQEEQRRADAELCRRHGIPSLDPIAGGRRRVVGAAHRKPEHEPMRFGLLLWGLLACVLGAPLAESVGYLLASKPGFGALGVLLGRFDGLAGGALLLAVVWWLLDLHMGRAVKRVREAVDRLAGEVARLFYGGGRPPTDEDRASIRSLFLTRLALTAALATRGFALRIVERSVANQRLASRLSRSVEIQELKLARLAEELGVRPAAGEAPGAGPRDDLRNLFATRSGEAVERLIDPRSLEAYFASTTGTQNDAGLGSIMARFIQESGGLAEWRRTACLADTERILRFCRHQFDAVVDTPLADQATFAGEIGSRLCAFIARHYSNIGFGAKFIGYEGLDPDGIQVSADGSLVVAPALRTLFERARRLPEALPVAASLDVVEAQVRPNVAYLLSLVQGIRAHSVRNLKRFESFHDRVHMPDDRTFPLSQEEQHGRPVNHLSSLGVVGTGLRGAIRTLGPNGTPAAPGSGPGSGHE